jgi:hypothetical protein
MSLIKAYERIERHQAGRTNPTDEPASMREQTPQEADGLGVEPDSLADPLTIPICNLTAPLPLESSVLGEMVYFVANDQQAAVVRAKGGIPYTAEEVDVLWALYQVSAPEAWRENLRLVHEAKRRFAGTIIPEGA